MRAARMGTVRPILSKGGWAHGGRRSAGGFAKRMAYSAKSRETGRAPLPISFPGAAGDTWWVQPLFTVVVLSLFGLYATVRAFQNSYFYYPWVSNSAPLDVIHGATYLSPFYSPYIPLRLSFGSFTLSPAIYILVFPLSFRLTCYYYRKAYYRSFFWDPPACALAEPNENARMHYSGERTIFIFQNFHRYALYAAIAIVLILWYDAFKSFFFVDNGVRHFGIGLGSLVFLINALLLSAYTFGCHSFRHLIGGGTDCYSCTALDRTRYGLWTKVSFLNKRHANFAWYSLFSVAIADIYVLLAASGVIQDVRIL